jgi:hypothetical protein
VFISVERRRKKKRGEKKSFFFFAFSIDYHQDNNIYNPEQGPHKR